MTRQRNSLPKKEQEEVTTRNLIKTERSNMPESEFKTKVIRILAGLEKSIEDIEHLLLQRSKKLKTSQAEIKKMLCNRETKPTTCNDNKDGRTRGMNQ